MKQENKNYEAEQPKSQLTQLTWISGFESPRIMYATEGRKYIMYSFDASGIKKGNPIRVSVRSGGELLTQDTPAPLFQDPTNLNHLPLIKKDGYSIVLSPDYQVHCIFTKDNNNKIFHVEIQNLPLDRKFTFYPIPKIYFLEINNNKQEALLFEERLKWYAPRGRTIYVKESEPVIIKTRDPDTNQETKREIKPNEAWFSDDQQTYVQHEGTTCRIYDAVFDHTPSTTIEPFSPLPQGHLRQPPS